jgi:hypothetical protein
VRERGRNNGSVKMVGGDGKIEESGRGAGRKWKMEDRRRGKSADRKWKNRKCNKRAGRGIVEEAQLGEDLDEMRRRYKTEKRKEKGGLRKKGRPNAETNGGGRGK